MQQQIKGIPGSAGIAKGTAKIILSLGEIKNFRKGDILVTPATSPTWTPIIHTASAVVTNVGGALSHAAIVCREYGIPAVVGTTNATKIIKNNQQIQVDGSKGIITLF